MSATRRNKRISEATYENVVLAQLRLEGQSDDIIDAMKIWLALSPEQKKIAKARLIEMGVEWPRQKEVQS